MSDVEFPVKLQFLFKPSRYKVLYGGRGGAKSWGVARALLLIGSGRKIRVLCAREFQNSIGDSVHKLLSEQIEEMGLSSFYKVQQNKITGRNGTEFGFEGLKSNVTKIKSYEGVDYCWVEEANTVSKTSWKTLIPTIRKEGSEIWITFNPELEEDETYQRFVVSPPNDAIVTRIGYQDNPWFPNVLEKERLELKEKDPDEYLTVWEGHCKQNLDGAIYAKELRASQEGGRICSVPYDASKPVDTFWDLGWADSTAIWFAQAIGFEYRIIDYLEDRQCTIAEYLTRLQNKGYVYGIDWLPHDAQAHEVGSGRSIEEIMKKVGRNVQITPKLDPNDGINAARTIFPQCYFDKEKTADGLHALRHYRYDVDKDTGKFSQRPLHDWASHGADAFRYLAVAIQAKKPKEKKPAIHQTQYRGSAWMR